VIERSNSCSALWQQVGFFCDVLVVSKSEDGQGQWYYDLTLPLVQELFGSDPDCEYYISMLRYGPEALKEGYTAFDHPHVHPHKSDLAYGDWTTEIHPVLLRYKGSELQIAYHVKSDVLTDWSSEYYTEPLEEFLRWDLEGGEQPNWVKPRRRELIRDEKMRSSGFYAEGVMEEALPSMPKMPQEQPLPRVAMGGSMGRAADPAE
jgi:hypothetical protein